MNLYERESKYYLRDSNCSAFFAGCAVGDLAGPIIVSFCCEKVFHVDL